MALWRSKSKAETGGEPEVSASKTENKSHTSEKQEKLDSLKEAEALLSSEQLKDKKQGMKRLATSLGEIVMLLMQTERYKALPLIELNMRVVPAITHKQFFLAEAQSRTSGMSGPVGLVLWARVSDEINAKLASSADNKIILTPKDWVSGSNYWVVEAIGAPQLLKAMLGHLCKKEWAGQTVKMRMSTKEGEHKIVELNATNAE